jgi:hypothetical protein
MHHNTHANVVSADSRIGILQSPKTQAHDHAGFRWRQREEQGGSSTRIGEQHCSTALQYRIGQPHSRRLCRGAIAFGCELVQGAWQNQAKKASAQSTKASTPITSNSFALALFVDDAGDEDEDDPSVVLSVLVVVAVVADPSAPIIRQI